MVSAATNLRQLLVREVRASAACGRRGRRFNMAPFEFGATGMSGDNPQGSDTPFEGDDPGAAGAEAGAAAAAPGPGEGAATPAAGPGDQDGASLSEGERLQSLEIKLAALQSENESLRGQYMRIAADFDNFRKRQSRDQDDLRLQITCSTLGEILPVVDNFERARQQLKPEHEEAQTLHGSYQGLYRQLVDVFKQLGVSSMRVEGEPFDPNLHEAVLREPSQEHREDVVIEELQRGYHLNGRVLRHALVKVSMGPGPSGSAAAPVEGSSEEQGG
jgi:molecular chaperone GrpE